MQLQRKLAYYAPATAIAVNMHFYWTGLAADMARMGDDSVRGSSRRQPRGHIFAAGHGESGNDVPILLSTTRAERVEGGWKFYGHKIFGSLSPVWTYLGLHGMDTSDPENPQVVHAFLARDAEASASSRPGTPSACAPPRATTRSSKAPLFRTSIALVCPPGDAGAGLFHVALIAWALLGFAAVYAGLAQRAFDMTIESAKKRTSIALTRPMAYHPEVQHEVAAMRFALESLTAHLDRCATSGRRLRRRHAWPSRSSPRKYVAVTQAWQVVDTALDLSGGSGIFKRTRMEQLFRDARLGRIHPANSTLTHESSPSLAGHQHDSASLGLACACGTQRRPAFEHRRPAVFPLSAEHRLTPWTAVMTGYKLLVFVILSGWEELAFHRNVTVTSRPTKPLCLARFFTSSRMTNSGRVPGAARVTSWKIAHALHHLTKRRQLLGANHPLALVEHERWDRGDTDFPRPGDAFVHLFLEVTVVQGLLQRPAINAHLVRQPHEHVDVADVLELLEVGAEQAAVEDPWVFRILEGKLRGFSARCEYGSGGAAALEVDPEARRPALP